MSRLNYMSLFAGIGGLDLGLDRAGMRCVAQVEIDPYCRRGLAKHWPDVPPHDDVRTAAEWWLSEERPAVDVICGGYPCQPFSTAGKMLGAGDDRHLWPAFLATVRAVRPRYVLAENVPAHLGIGFDRVLADLAGVGFDAQWSVVPASAMGAPQRRPRLLLVAYPEGGERLDRRWLSAVQASRRQDNAMADAHRCRTHDTGPADAEPWTTEPDLGRVASRLSPGMDGDLNAHPSCITQARTAGLPETRRLRALRDYLGSPTASREPPRCNLCGHPLSTLPCSGACSPWYLGGWREEAEDLRCMQEGVLGLLAREGEDVLPFLPSRDGPTQRTETLGSRNDRLHALGNAVVPQVAEYVGRLIVAHAGAVAA